MITISRRCMLIVITTAGIILYTCGSTDTALFLRRLDQHVLISQPCRFIDPLIFKPFVYCYLLRAYVTRTP